MGREKDQPCARSGDGLPDDACLVAAEIVHDDDVARTKAGHQNLLDIAEKAVAVDGSIKDAWCRDLVDPQGSEEG